MEAATSTRWYQQTVWRWMVLILVVGFGLRIWQIGYGLPRVLFTDEEFFTIPALRIADGSWNPQWFGAGASPQIYTIGVTWKLQNSFVNLAARQHLTPTERYAADPTPLIIAARLFSVLFGTYTILLVFWIGRKVSSSVGLVAAALTAGNFFLVDHSHVVRPDIWQTAFLLQGLLALIDISTKPKRWRGYILFALSAGLAVTQKYTSVVVAPLVLGVVWVMLRRRMMTWWQLTMTAGLTFFVIIASLPYVLITPYNVFRDLAIEIIQKHNIHTGLGWFGNMEWYARSLDWQLGTILGVSTIIIFVWCWVRNKVFNPSHFLFVSAVVYTVFLSFSNHAWDRWMIPVISMLAVPMAVSIVWVIRLRRQRWVVTPLLVLALLPPVARLVRTELGYTIPPTVEMVRTWALQHAPAGALFTTDPYSPTQIPDRRTERISTLGVRTLDGFQDSTYLIANDDIKSNLLALAKRYGASSSYAIVGGRYATIERTWQVAYSTDPIIGRTPKELLWQNDWRIFQDLTLVVRRGPVLTVYQR